MGRHFLGEATAATRSSTACPPPRSQDTSHYVFTMPWPGDPRVNSKFQVRVPEEVHRRLAIRAAEQGVSLNALAAARLAST